MFSVENSLISVIIPVYNSERWLSRCLDSVISQTYKQLDILIIDDGSTDSSGNICDNYASKDSRIRVFHQTNQGVSASRQKGVDSAMGSYIIHVDSDDWIDINMISQLYNKAKIGDYDMVICDYYEEQSGYTKYCNQDPKSSDPIEILHKLLSQQLHGSCCNKLVKRVCYNLPDVTFPKEINIYEDLYVTSMMLINNISVAYLPEAFYHYSIGYSDNTLSNRITHKSVVEKINFIQIMEHKLSIKQIYGLGNLKKDVLFCLFVLRDYNLMNKLYPETNRFVVSEEVRFNLFCPNRYVLKTALCGKVNSARLILLFCSIAIKIKQIIKQLSFIRL